MRVLHAHLITGSRVHPEVQYFNFHFSLRYRLIKKHGGGEVLDLEDGSVSKGPNKKQTLLSVFRQLRSWQMESESEQQQS